MMKMQTLSIFAAWLCLFLVHADDCSTSATVTPTINAATETSAATQTCTTTAPAECTADLRICYNADHTGTPGNCEIFGSTTTFGNTDAITAFQFPDALIKEFTESAGLATPDGQFVISAQVIYSDGIGVTPSDVSTQVISIPSVANSVTTTFPVTIAAAGVQFDVGITSAGVCANGATSGTCTCDSSVSASNSS